MAKVLVTGLPGTGKSSALAELAQRGYRVVDTDDDGWCEYRAYPRQVDELHRGEFHWNAARMNALLDSDDGRTLFVAGIVRNQESFYDRFGAVVLLSAPVEVMLDRVSRRTTNTYGQTARDRAEIVADLAEIEPLLRATCTHELDAARPLNEVVSDLIAIASHADAA
jgi:dephospho-CoA kinase